MAGSSFGTLLQMNIASTFTSIAEVMDIGGPGLGQDLANVTTQESSNKYQEGESTLKDPGEVVFELNYVTDDPTHDPTTGLISAFESGQPSEFRMIFPELTQWSFNAIVLGIEPSEPVDGQLSSSISFQLTGNVIFGTFGEGFPYTFPYILS